MGEHFVRTQCPRCETIVWHLNTEEPACRCGWDLDEDFADHLRDRCDGVGEDYEELLDDLGGDLEMVDSYLRVLEKDD
jgi:hypothetical protein